MRAFLILVSSLAAMAMGCASASFYDMPKVEGEFSTALQTADNSEHKSKADFEEKKALVATLKSKNSSDYKAIATQLSGYLTAMEKSLADIAARKSSMRTANSSIASLSYTKKKISGDDPQYKEVDSAVKEFKVATEDVNRGLKEYATASDHLTEAVSARKLIFNFDVPAFHDKVRAQVTDAQENLNEMQTTLNSISGQGMDEKLAWNEMKATAEKFAAKAQGLAKISQTVDAQALGATKISNLDNRWPVIQKQVTEFDQTVVQLGQLRERFQRGAQSFKSR